MTLMISKTEVLKEVYVFKVPYALSNAWLGLTLGCKLNCFITYITHYLIRWFKSFELIGFNNPEVLLIILFHETKN